MIFCMALYETKSRPTTSIVLKTAITDNHNTCYAKHDEPTISETTKLTTTTEPNPAGHVWEYMLRET